MAQWIQTLEPYVKVQETVKTAPLNPTAGEDLIIGVVLISDAGPSNPTLISSQSEFLSTYASSDITQDYLDSLKELYTGSDKEIAPTMWANAYRLAGSNTLLVVRASKAADTYFSKSFLATGNINPNNQAYLLRDGYLMKGFKGSGDSGIFRLTIDENGATDGWAIAISGVGVFGNLTKDSGAKYDYFVNNLPDLVDQLNETSKFFSPNYKYFKDVNCSSGQEITIDADSSASDRGLVKGVMFYEAYLGSKIIDTSNKLIADYDTDTHQGLAYVLFSTPENLETQLDLNNSAWSGFKEVPYYASNVYNSATKLRVRVRRFNHDAVVTKSLSSGDTSNLTENGASPYTVLNNVLDTFTNNGTDDPATNPLKANIAERDFFEIAVWDPSVNSEVSFFNVGNILGRGDMEVSEINNLLNMIQLTLPDDLHDLGLNYYGYVKDNTAWEVYTFKAGDVVTGHVASIDKLPDTAAIGAIYSVGGSAESPDSYYKSSMAGNEQIYLDLRIDPSDYSILSVSDTDLKKALDQIELDEVYVTEGLCDLGNTEPSFQNYMANMAINSNYFYPISTVNSTNYMTIGNSISKISQDSYKLYASAPWDIDTGSLGWKYYASPAVLYWEAVARNRRNNEEFRGVFGQNGGIVQYQRPVTEFNKKTRQLLLSKKINTVLWNIQTQAWNLNDNYTKQSVDNIMADDGNSRLAIRIGKAMPRLLRQFWGRQISQVLCDEMKGVIDYFFKTVILPMTYTVNGYQIFCDYDEVLARQNKVNVTVNVRFFRSLKFITVFLDLYDLGLDISTDGHKIDKQ